MKIADFLKKECCVVKLKSPDKEGAIREMVCCLREDGKVKDPEKFIKEILKRENMGSTGIGYGVALPHARTDAVSDFVIAFGHSKNGIDFNSLDEDKVKLVFLMGANPHELNLYLRLLAELSKLLLDASFRSLLLKASSREEIIEIFRKFEA